MREAIGPLASWMVQARSWHRADLYTITLNGGGSPLRYTNSDVDVVTPAVTNLCLRSREFDNASWSKVACTITANALAAPDGTETADKLVETTATSQHRCQQTIATTPGAVYTYSCFMHAGERNFGRIVLLTGSDSFSGHADLTTGATQTFSGGAGITGAAFSALDWGGGWWRLIIAGAVAPGASLSAYAAVCQTLATASYTGDASKGIYLWEAQFETGSAAKIPVTTAGTSASLASRTFTRGPKIKDSGVKSAVGLRVDTLDVTFDCDERDLIGSVPFVTYVANGGFDGATIGVERLISAGPDYPNDTVGIYPRFQGRMSALSAIGGSGLTVRVASWAELLNVNMPPDVYQSSCRFPLYGTGCGLTRASFTTTGTCSSGCTTTTLATDAAGAAGYFDLGVIVFTSGANNGLKRTIRKGTGSGGLTLIAPLPAAPANGDTFSIYPGCDLRMTTCNTKFSNLARFGGQPFIPDPTTGL